VTPFFYSVFKGDEEMKKTIFSCAVLFSTMFVLPCLGADYTGMWWDAEKPGTGVYIDYTEGPNNLCGSWYLYDQRGNPLWVTFLGTLSGKVFTTGLYKFTGPPMGGMWDNSAVRGERTGNVTIDFSNPDKLVMTYEIERESGTLNLTRFSSQECAGSLWWDVEKQGQGVAHFHFAGAEGEDLTGLVWYVYDTEGNPIWYTATGNATATTFDAWQFTGPPLGETWDTSLLKKEKAGTIKAEFNQLLFTTERLPKLDMDYTIRDISGHLSLEPFMCPVAVTDR